MWLCLVPTLVSYYATVPDDSCDSELLKLATDKCLFVDDAFLPIAQKYKESQDAFFEDYKKVCSDLPPVFQSGGFITSIVIQPRRSVHINSFPCLNLVAPLITMASVAATQHGTRCQLEVYLA